jgi:membrane-bound serine protease (ClpP class)
MPVLLEPNIVYLILVLGLWMGVTAAFVPGTGVIELIGAGIVFFAVYLLTNLQVNWWALMLLIVGAASFIAMPFLKRGYTLLAVAGLALQAVGATFLFQVTQVSPLVTAATLAIAFAYHQFALRPALERMRLRPLTDDDASLIGARGRVVRSLAPIGTIHVQGESWTAQSDEPIPMGEEVVVVERDGLRLIVEAVKHKNDEPN